VFLFLRHRQKSYPWAEKTVTALSLSLSLSLYNIYIHIYIAAVYYTVFVCERRLNRCNLKNKKQGVDNYQLYILVYTYTDIIMNHFSRAACAVYYTYYMGGGLCTTNDPGRVPRRRPTADELCKRRRAENGETGADEGREL